MSLRLYCSACHAAFLVPEDRRGASVACPKCSATLEIPPTTVLATASVSSSSDEAMETARSRRRWSMVALAAVATMLFVGGVAAWLRPWNALKSPKPRHPSEAAASEYLQALVAGDFERARKLGTVSDPPAIRSFETPVRDRRRSRSVRDSFAPIAKLHARIDREYQFDSELGRFKPRNALVPAAETLDTLHAAKAKAEQEKVYEKMASGDPDDIFDAAESFGSLISGLAENVLSPQKLLPTYQQLVNASKPPLPAAQRELALDYAEDRDTWDALLKRPFLTLKADGPFVLDRVEVAARVRDKLASSGDPPTTLRLTLTRFRLEGIDTGWKVTAARRDQPESEEPSSQDRTSTPPAPPRRRSPGEREP